MGAKIWFFAASVVANIVVCAANAQTASSIDLSKCSEVKGDIERLACFDNLTKSIGAVSPAVSAQTIGGWGITTETSKIDDSRNVSLSLESDNEIDGRFGATGKANVEILCREHKTDIYFTFAGAFLAEIEGYGDLTIRIDKTPARTIKMNESTDHKALGLWRGSGENFIKSMFGSQRMLVRVTPFNENAVTAEFNVKDLEQAIVPLRAACKW
jgi:type VI secretion system protein VasI